MLINCLVGWLVGSGWLDGLVGWLVGFGCLVGWLVGWLVGCLVGLWGDLKVFSVFSFAI